MLDRLTEEQKAELVRRYQDGESTRSLAVEFRYTKWSILNFLQSLPDVDTAARKQVASDIHTISADALEELYWGRRLSIRDIRKLFHCCHEVIAKKMLEYGIKMRSDSEEQKNNISKSRKPINREILAANGKKGGSIAGPRNIRKALAAVNAKSRQKSAATQMRRKRHPCCWCGLEIERKLSSLAARRTICCGYSHSASHRNHVRHRGPNAPRPLITEALWKLAEKDKPTRERVRSGPGIGTWLPHTPERLLKLGENIGARMPEVEAVIDRQREEAQALIEKQNG